MKKAYFPSIFSIDIDIDFVPQAVIERLVSFVFILWPKRFFGCGKVGKRALRLQISCHFSQNLGHHHFTKQISGERGSSYHNVAFSEVSQPFSKYGT